MTAEPDQYFAPTPAIINADGSVTPPPAPVVQPKKIWDDPFTDATLTDRYTIESGGFVVTSNELFGLATGSGDNRLTIPSFPNLFIGQQVKVIPGLSNKVDVWLAIATGGGARVQVTNTGNVNFFTNTGTGGNVAVNAPTNAPFWLRLLFLHATLQADLYTADPSAQGETFQPWGTWTLQWVGAVPWAAKATPELRMNCSASGVPAADFAMDDWRIWELDDFKWT